MAFVRGPVPSRFDRLVSATPAQFERDLRASWPAVSGSADGGVLRVEGDGAALAIGLQVLPVRRLGLFELPQLRVDYCFEAGDERARRRLLTLLDRGMQKGGG